MKHRLQDQALALAGVVQAAVLVHRIAQGERLPSDCTAPLIESIFVTNPETIQDVYGSPETLKVGITTTRTLLQKPEPGQMPALKYALNLLDVEKALRRHPDRVSKLAAGIADIDQVRANIDYPEVLARLAALYKSTISTLSPRIKVTGQANSLSQRQVAEEIRSLLLAGVRFAWLWHQAGGRRWKLLLQRAALREALENNLSLPEIH